ncbi:MAG: AI-2E family transporter [Anaerolineales bacterium]|nr:AI-2E family transporter [Anaerolineales bacterium]
MSKQWSLASRYLVLALIIGLIIWFIVAANALWGPLAISALLAFVLNPVVVLVNKRTRLERHWVVLLVYLMALALIVALAIIIVPNLPQHIDSFSIQFENIIAQVITNFEEPISILGMQISMATLISLLPSLSFSAAQADIIIDIIRSTSTNIAWVLIVVVTTYYLLQDWLRLRAWILKAVPSEYEYDFTRIYIQLRDVWQRYLQGQLRLMIIVGFVTGVAATAIGLQGAWLFGLLAGIFDVVMSVGPMIVMIFAAIVALFTGSAYLPIPNVWFALLVLVIFGLIQVIENIWLRPRIMRQTLRLHPALVFVGVIAALATAGILVALIIVPLMSSVLVIARYLYCKILDIDPWD